MKCYLKLNYNSNEIIEIQAETALSTYYNGEMQILLIHIHDYYDEALWVNAHGIVDRGFLNCNITSPLESGLYALSCIKEKESGTFIYGDPEAGKNFGDRWYASGVFSVDMGGTEEKYRTVIEYIQRKREEMFLAIKTEDQPMGTDIFEVFVFLKNIKVKTVLYYGDIELIPFHDFKCLSEISIINDYMHEQEIQLDFEKENSSGIRPTAIAHVQNIQSGDGIEAEKLAIKKTEMLCYLYSFLTHGNGEIFAVVSLNKTNQTSHKQIIHPYYTGDLLLLGDQGFYLRHLYENLSGDNAKALMYLKMFNEAMRENKRMSRYFKLWMTLVTIAEGKSYEGKAKRNWNGSLDGDKRIQLRDKQIIFELLREMFSAEDPSQNRFKVESIESVDEYIDICYQRRNCYAHHGTCIINDDSVCKNDNIHKLCKEHYRDDAECKSIFDDSILWNLESIVNEIIRRELKQTIGESRKEQTLIESYLLQN